MRISRILQGACSLLLAGGSAAGAEGLSDELWSARGATLIPRYPGIGTTLSAALPPPQTLDLRPEAAPLVLHANAQGRFTSMRLSLFGGTGVFLNRLDARCNGELATRCSLYSLAFGVHGASANLQWRVDGARALVPDHEFAHDAIHVRFQATYTFD